MMGARHAIALAAAFTLIAAQAPAAAPTPPKPPSQEQAKEAFFYFRVMVSAIQSDKVETPVKDALLGCIYTNSLGKIAEAMDKAIAANGNKINKTDPNQVLGVMAGICGYRPAKAPAQPAPKK